MKGSFRSSATTSPVTSQFGQTPPPQHRMDCSGSCFQRTYPLLSAIKPIFRKTINVQPNSKIRCKKDISARNLRMIGRWKATKGLFEAILFHGGETLTGGTGKDISKLF